jgi:hypothetical protein
MTHFAAKCIIPFLNSEVPVFFNIQMMFHIWHLSSLCHRQEYLYEHDIDDITGSYGCA